ncbi:hypothetical protein N6H14_25280 [Paenibacillus sp. CC-CFT747]|nr:hypothetical protein N6H14_25280 [Paenibacillus sp. CC-CFT747]
MYHPTMLYITVGGLLYEYLTHGFVLWKFHPDFLYNHPLTVIVYAVLTMPLTVLLFLSRYPGSGSIQEKAVYYLFWVGCYSFFEWVLYLAGRISYDHGWNLGHSILFDIMMFPMLRFHFVKPLGAYSVSVLIIIYLMVHFDVPFESPMKLWP